MNNRVIFRQEKRGAWVEIILVGQRPLSAMIDLEDLEKVREYRWGYHPRGPFDHSKGILLSHIVLPGARRIYFRNWNRLDCRKANLFTEKEAGALRKRRVPNAKGVYYDPVRCAYIAHFRTQGVQVFGYFAVRAYESAAAAEKAALSRRAEFLKMSLAELVAYKSGRDLAEHEQWLGEDVAAALAKRIDDPREIALKGFQAGVLAGKSSKAADFAIYE